MSVVEQLDFTLGALGALGFILLCLKIITVIAGRNPESKLYKTLRKWL